MDTSSNENGAGSGGTEISLYYVEECLADVLENQEQLTGQVEALQSEVESCHADFVAGAGLLSALFGVLVGYAVVRDLLKVWVS